MKEDCWKIFKKLTLFFLSNPVLFNGQDYKNRKGPGTSDQSLLSLQNRFEKISLLMMLPDQVWWCRHGQIARPRPIGRAQACKTSEVRPIFRAHILPSKKEKLISSTNFQSNRQKNEKVTVNTKYCCEHQCTCNILMFTCLMMSKLIYLLID